MARHKLTPEQKAKVVADKRLGIKRLHAGMASRARLARQCKAMQEPAAQNMTIMIIYDDVGMVHDHAAIAVDRIVQSVTWANRPAGGITIVLMGDFAQLQP